ncbi:MAG: hypothetical protein NTX24_03805 [Candidatus Pacearchaeota archaeon]|nr:hypothetical protein [Candidatus Pacearchaeota archaeon]
MNKQNKMKEIAKETRQTSKLLVAALIATLALFLLGFFLGNYVASSRIEQFRQGEEKLLSSIMGLEVRDQIIGNESICNLNWDDIWGTKVSLGDTLTTLEKRMGKENPDVMLQKEMYELIEIKTLMMVQNIKDNCHEDFNIVLFFYTNKKDDPKGSAAGSEDQGLILDQIVFAHNNEGEGRKVHVFAFDVNSENPATRALIAKYEITEVPSLIINGEKYPYIVKADLENVL